jgi:hypothetical protein
MIVNRWANEVTQNPDFSAGFTPELVSGLGRKIVQGQPPTGLDAADTDAAIIRTKPFTSTVRSATNWGLSCRHDNGWVAVGCGMSTEGNIFSSTNWGADVDADMSLVDNGCYSDQEELGTKLHLFIRCMKTEVQP